MKASSRINAILSTTTLDSSITGFPTFSLAEELILDKEVRLELPTHLRLGHLIEKVVAALLQTSSKYNILYKNLQIIEAKNTIGELDFILENTISKQCLHLELAYKFYLYDPSISDLLVNNWIGPNRKDSLVEKLNKLKTKQFPLLHHDCTKDKLSNINIHEVSQVLCLLASLFVPYQFKGTFPEAYAKAIIGYYINYTTFLELNHTEKTYYIPSKKEWGISPSHNTNWSNLSEVSEQLTLAMQEKQSVLVWQKQYESYTSFFVVWW